MLKLELFDLNRTNGSVEIGFIAVKDNLYKVNYWGKPSVDKNGNKHFFKRSKARSFIYQCQENGFVKIIPTQDDHEMYFSIVGKTTIEEITETFEKLYSDLVESFKNSNQ